MVKSNLVSDNEDFEMNRPRHSKQNKQSMKKNMQRLGGRGLSLHAFANAKTFNKDYNPSIIKKKKEFYRNAKFVKKYQRSVKHQEQQPDLGSTSMNHNEEQNSVSVDARYKEDRNGAVKEHNFSKKRRGGEKSNAFSLTEVYKKKREEEEKARLEREALFQAKKEERQKAETRRKDLREKMFKKTRKGQPVMKYRIEHLLETIQASN